MGQVRTHDEHPYATPTELRDPVRQLRGRLAAPVTIVTAGDQTTRTGLTVSSFVVAEGDPALAYCLLGPTTDLLEIIEKTQRFVVHVCDTEHRDVADFFAGVRPSPGGRFAERNVVDTPHGPLIAGFGTYTLCSLLETRDESFSVVVTARIDDVVVHPLTDPLLYFRGAYRALEE